MAPDIVNKQTRSRMMAGIRAKNTKPEMFVRSSLHRRGFRFRIHDKKLPGKPDIVLPKYRVIVNVHGCFWHLHRCHLFKWPATRADWWEAKLTKTRATDETTQAALLEKGWRVATVWECALKGKTKLDPEYLLNALTEWIIDADESDTLVLEGSYDNVMPRVARF